MIKITERLNEVDTIIHRLARDYPKLVGPFFGYIKGVDEEGALDKKAKSLIAVALAVARQCEWCIAQHTKAAMDEGATVDEIVEACAVAIMMSGAPAMMHVQLVLQTVDELQSDN